MAATSLVFDLFVKGNAPGEFLRVASAADKAAAATAKATSGMSAASARMGKTGKVLTKSLTLPLLGIGVVAVDQAAKFQKSMNTIQVATDRTNAQMAAGSKGLLNIAKQTGTSVQGLSDSFYVASKSGLSVAKSLAVTKAAAQAAKVENADLATVTDALTSVMASYGKTLRDPVAAMNEIVKGAAIAKTTTQDFSASLSNVVPIASSLGIGFDQVAGAIATMTQHGETAQRATENLANLITNLAGQNNVASAALQQLGVNTISLSKNLGKRGLVGSLNDVLHAIGKHSRDGLIVTSAFKQAATATRSLRTEIAALPKPMQANAKAFIAGKMSFKEYNAYAKSLGGQNYHLAKGILATAAQAQGFNNQLKSGNSNVRTLASTLQKALGGVTGMRVALMLSGQSAKQFARATSEVKKAATATKGDVLGWSNTQGLLSTKIDKAKAALQTMAIELGTALIPAVSKIVGWVSKAVHWFDGLSGTQKKILGWSAGILAALGPILTIGSRLSRVGMAMGQFAMNAGQKIGLLAGSTERTANRVSGILRGMVRGMNGILAGAVAGQIGGGSSGGWLASILLGGAGGWALGGPVGAAVGGITAAISKGIGLWHDHKNAAKEAALAEKAWVDSLTQSIKADNDAIGAGTRLQVTQKLSDEGLLKKARALRLPVGDVLNAALGNGGAFGQDVDNALNVLQAKLSARIALLNQQKKQFFATHQPGVQLPRGLGQELAGQTGVVADLNKQIKAYKDYRDAILGKAHATSQALAKDRLELQTLNDSRLSTGAYTAQLSALAKKQSEALTGQGNLTASLRAGSVEGDHNRKVISGLVTAAQQDADSVRRAAAQHGSWQAAVKAGNSVFARHVSEIMAAAKAAGFNKTQVSGLLRDLGVLGGTTAKPKIILDDGATTPLMRIQEMITGLHGRDLYVRVHQINSAGVDQLGAQPGNSHSRHHAAGGPVRDGYFTVGERGWELGYKQGSKVTIFDNNKSKAMTGWDRVPGFAHGSKPDQGTLSSRVSSAIGNVGTAPGAKFYVNDVGIVLIRKQIKRALAVLSEEIGKGLSKHAAAAFRKEIAGYVREANRQLAALRLKIRGSDVRALRTALKGTVDDTRTAMAALIADLQHAGVSKSQIARAGRLGSQLVAAQGRYQAAGDYRTSVMDTLRGNFDPSKYGSVADLLTGLGTATGSNRKYEGEVGALRRKAGGNKRLLAFINQLAAQGDSATLETLAGASKTDLAQVTKAVGAYNASVTAGGNAAELAKFGTSFDQFGKDVRELVTAVAHVAVAMGESNFELDGQALDRRNAKQLEAALHQLRTLVNHGRKG